MMNLFTTWQFVLVLFFANFTGALCLKFALVNTVKENQWLKYIFIIPPTALICWLLALIYFLCTLLRDIIRDYFKN